jgi:hypothetical protein
MADIFLSYANEDRETARALAALLESSGWTVWWDRRIPAGRTWRSMIEEALGDMRCMVVLWSTHSVESDWVKEEAEEARTLGKLIPVLIQPVKPPVGFRSIQAADLTDWDGASVSSGARQLVADLESRMGKPAPREPAEAEDSGRKNPPIPVPLTEGDRDTDNKGIGINETGSPAPSRSVPETESAPKQFSRKLGVGWKTAAAAVFIIVAVVGSLMWIEKRSTREQAEPPELQPTVKQPDIAPASPAPVSAPSLASVGLSADRQEVLINETLDFALRGEYTDGTQKEITDGVQWLSSDPRVATIDGQGRITARQAGETKITARYGDLVTPAWSLAVRPEKPAIKTPPPTKLVSLTLSAGRRELEIQQRLSLRVKGNYSDGSEKSLARGIEWRSSDASIAAIDSRGELLALRPGKIAVVARWGGIESSPLDIVVKESPRKPSPKPPTPSTVVGRPQVTPAKSLRPTVDVAPYINRAKGHRVQGNYSAALAELEKARALNPASEEVRDEIEITKQACNAEKKLGREGLIC